MPEYSTSMTTSPGDNASSVRSSKRADIFPPDSWMRNALNVSIASSSSVGLVSCHETRLRPVRDRRRFRRRTRRAHRLASRRPRRVAEEYRIGGTCVVRGCVPKKFLVYGAEFSQMIADAAGYGWTIGSSWFDWPTLRDNGQ